MKITLAKLQLQEIFKMAKDLSATLNTVIEAHITSNRLTVILRNSETKRLLSFELKESYEDFSFFLPVTTIPKTADKEISITISPFDITFNFGTAHHCLLITQPKTLENSGEFFKPMEQEKKFEFKIGAGTLATLAKSYKSSKALTLSFYGTESPVILNSGDTNDGAIFPL